MARLATSCAAAIIDPAGPVRVLTVIKGVRANRILTAPGTLSIMEFRLDTVKGSPPATVLSNHTPLEGPRNHRAEGLALSFGVDLGEQLGPRIFVVPNPESLNGSPLPKAIADCKNSGWELKHYAIFDQWASHAPWARIETP